MQKIVDRLCILFIVAVWLSTCTFARADGPTYTETEVRNGHKSSFWMVGRENMPLSEQVLRNIAEKGYSQIVLGLGRSGDVGGLYNDLPTYNYPKYAPASIAARIKQLNPHINIMLYMRQGTHYLANYLGGSVYDTLALEPDAYLRDYGELSALPVQEIIERSDSNSFNHASSDGLIYSFKNGLRFDWSNNAVGPAFVSALTSAYNDVETFGADGFLFDDNIINPENASAAVADSFNSYLTSGQVTQSGFDAKKSEWMTNARAFYGDLRDAGIPAFFNSISFNQTTTNPARITIERYENRLDLLSDDSLQPLQEGASIEKFCSTGSSGSLRKIATDANLYKLASLPDLYPQQTFLFQGRAPIASYMGYAEEYKWYRYCYGLYLIGTGASNNSSFSYTSNFRLTSKFRITTGTSMVLPWGIKMYYWAIR